VRHEAELHFGISLVTNFLSQVRVSHVALHPGASIILQLCPSIFRNTFSIPETDFSGTIVGQPGKVVFGSIPVGEQ